jgi:alkyldihydroxyacetonephosphate synthase
MQEMSLTRAEIVENLARLVGRDQLVTDEMALKLSSVDRFRRYEELNGVFVLPPPAAVVNVRSADQIAAVLRFANENGINVVPRTGRSATEGGLETVVENSIVVDGSSMNRIVKIDTYNMQATAQCGAPLATLENAARAAGLTTGHQPQSQPLAHMGGLTATRSIGQLSTLYGGIEDLVVGLEAVFPNGEICRIKNIPRRAAGPDIRHIAIGNEGMLCFITEVTVKLFRYQPQNSIYLGYALDRMKDGFEILREVMVEGYRPSVARLYDAEDGGCSFPICADGKCMLIFVAEGAASIAAATGAGIDEIVARHGGCEKVDPAIIRAWFANLLWGPDKVAQERTEIMATQNIGNTTEIAADWSSINGIYERVCSRIREEIPDVTLVGGHSSHSYINGTNLYFVHYYNLVDIRPEEEIVKYHHPIKKLIVDETLRGGGTMCHHHGVGKHRAPWIRNEYGSSYYMLETLKRAFDPNGVMNKGTIIPLT